MAPRASKGFSSSRRRLVKALGTAAAGGWLASVNLTAAGCAGDAEGGVAVSMDDLPLGTRMRVLVNEHPVELLRTESGVQARSLWCTHTGCEVRWSGEQQRYICPCHDGLFDADGKVVAGPPPRPLPSYPIRVTETEVWLEPEAEG